MKILDWLAQAKIGNVGPIPDPLVEFLAYQGFLYQILCIAALSLVFLFSWISYKFYKDSEEELMICFGFFTIFFIMLFLSCICNIFDVYSTPTHYLLNHTKELKYLMK